MGKGNIDVEFEMLIDKQKNKVSQKMEHVQSDKMGICVCVRKRPLFDKEFKEGEIDCVSATNPKCVIHECKFRVDGITRYIEDN
jgi:kinesin family protein 2/24